MKNTWFHCFRNRDPISCVHVNPLFPALENKCDRALRLTEWDTIQWVYKPAKLRIKIQLQLQFIFASIYNSALSFEFSKIHSRSEFKSIIVNNSDLFDWIITRSNTSSIVSSLQNFYYITSDKCGTLIVHYSQVLPLLAHNSQA